MSVCSMIKKNTFTNVPYIVPATTTNHRSRGTVIVEKSENIPFVEVSGADGYYSDTHNNQTQAQEEALAMQLKINEQSQQDLNERVCL
ncbi:hypothetical protein BdWA1_002587 [Babesia duncani]|uniref:Uncharacterized protein n=1 Tax=Babesia duncani TaxID=323732 RepID=A0AAD9PJF1_9APIC|nr:hypothetical protein BdWA1_002587 [Babesia duncani]